MASEQNMIPTPSDDIIFHPVDAGFQMEFPCGHSLSVQYGVLHYCSNRDYSVEGAWRKKHSDLDSTYNAEIAILNPSRELLDLGNDSVAGFVTFSEIITIMEMMRLGQIHEVVEFLGSR